MQVGYQHHYTSTWQGLRDIVNKDGFLGLWRGVEGQMLRVGVGSAVQLSFYDQASYKLSQFKFLKDHPDLLPFFSSLFTGFFL